MRLGVLVVALAALLCGSGSASAQALSLEFHDGRVRLVAQNVPVSRILSEWARLGGTRIVNGERVPGAPVTLQLLDVPEQQALDVVLRGAAGYMAAARETANAGGSILDRVLILPTTARAPSPASLPPPAPPPVPFGDDADDVLIEEPDDQQIDPPDQDQNGPPAGIAPFPRGRVVRPGVVLPRPAPLPESEVDNGVQDENPPSVTPRRSNPFGTLPGMTRPGTITPPPPENPDGGPGR